nr:unnamed protein product [Callosobruchus chinensis]
MPRLYPKLIGQSLPCLQEL